jgi:hypothetical protein
MKQGVFVGDFKSVRDFKFVGTDKYNSNTFIGAEN